MEFSQVKSKAIAHMSRIENVRTDYSDNLAKIKRNENDLNTVNSIYTRTLGAYKYLEKLVDIESGRFIRKIQDLVTVGLQTIFFDKPDYSCEIRVEGSDASIHLVYTDEESGVKLSPIVRYPSLMGATGGGIASVIGVIMQVYFINYYMLSLYYLLMKDFHRYPANIYHILWGF
jgi:hypothetical protein